MKTLEKLFAEKLLKIKIKAFTWASVGSRLFIVMQKYPSLRNFGNLIPYLLGQVDASGWRRGRPFVYVRFID